LNQPHDLRAVSIVAGVNYRSKLVVFGLRQASDKSEGDASRQICTTYSTPDLKGDAEYFDQRENTAEYEAEMLSQRIYIPGTEFQCFSLVEA
jgi:hypothetical protein